MEMAIEIILLIVIVILPLACLAKYCLGYLFGKKTTITEEYYEYENEEIKENENENDNKG